MRKYIQVISLVLACLWLAACGPQGAFGGSPLAWIDAPLDGSTFPVTPLDVISHAADPSGITQFELRVNGALVSSDASPDTKSALATISQSWSPAAPGDYTLQVRAENPAGVWSDFATVNVHIGFPAGPPTLTVPPPPTATATPTPNPLSTLITFTPIRNVNCRYGPGQVYAVLNSVLAGNPLPVEGRNEDKNWVYVRLQGNGCWIGLANGNLDGDINQVPFHPYPPPPTATPTPVLGCYQYDANQQLGCVAPCSPNAQPGGSCTP
jgi:hypothetical protein